MSYVGPMFTEPLPIPWTPEPAPTRRITHEPPEPTAMWWILVLTLTILVLI